MDQLVHSLAVHSLQLLPFVHSLVHSLLHRL
jgi:hypothetical protein